MKITIELDGLSYPEMEMVARSLKHAYYAGVDCPNRNMSCDMCPVRNGCNALCKAMQAAAKAVWEVEK